jgi:hypothetical protein
MQLPACPSSSQLCAQALLGRHIAALNDFWFAGGLLQVWNWVMEPMLFATIGISIVFAKLPQGTIPKSVLVVCTGALAAAAYRCYDRVWSTASASSSYVLCAG